MCNNSVVNILLFEVLYFWCFQHYFAFIWVFCTEIQWKDFITYTLMHCFKFILITFWNKVIFRCYRTYYVSCLYKRCFKYLYIYIYRQSLSTLQRFWCSGHVFILIVSTSYPYSNFDRSLALLSVQNLRFYFEEH